MYDFFADDITFCASECDKEECFRHPSNIKQPQYPHSFAGLKGTEYCPDQELRRPEHKADDMKNQFEKYMNELKRQLGRDTRSDE